MTASSLAKETQFDPPALMSAEDLFPPRAYIIGAPKCGTTALTHYLSRHPSVAFCRPKEPHFFSQDLHGLARTTDMDEYRKLFRKRDTAEMTMEGSVWYLYSQTAIPEILKVRPDARFIVMLRNPVNMLVSLHQQLLNALDETEADFRTAWELSGARARGEDIPKGCRAPSTLIYTRTAAFGEMLERLFSQVDRDRCLVIFQEDMHADTGAVYRKALDFLGIADDGRTEFKRVNEAAQRRSRTVQYIVARGGTAREAVSKPIKRLLGVKSLGLLQLAKRLNAGGAEKPKLPQDLIDEIAAHYAADMRKLSRLLKVDVAARYGWPVPPSTGTVHSIADQDTETACAS